MAPQILRLDDVDIGLHMAMAISEAENYNECSATVSTAHSNLVIAELLLRTQENRKDYYAIRSSHRQRTSRTHR